MADQVNRVVQKDNTTVDGEGAVVREKTRATSTQVDSKVTVANIIWYIYGLMAILLALRFVLRLFGANSANGFVSFIYAVSGVLSAPFDSIFGVTKAASGNVSSVFEPSILVAIAVYGLIAWGLAKLLTLNEPRPTV
ncbi:MAG: hypothetical protein ABI221_02080 [Candidatus Saccharimonadales bacterium]